MGNANNVVREMPEDLAKSSNDQLQLIIETAIVNNPWFSQEGNGYESSQKNLFRTLAEMKNRGFRPITPSEYRLQLHSSKGKIMLWRKDENYVQNDYDTETSRSLPTTLSEITEITEELFGDAYSTLSTHSRMDTKLDTEEWPTANVYEFE